MKINSLKIAVFSLALSSLLAVALYAIGPRRLYHGPKVTVTTGTAVALFSANSLDSNRVGRNEGPYTIAIGNSTVDCTDGFPLKNGEFMRYPEGATYSVYGISCGASSSTFYKLRDQ